jgi:hypothetical protein
VVAFSFPTDNSTQSQIDRITGVLITLQNLRGPGQGCPAASTTLVAERNKLATQLSGGSPSSTTGASPDVAVAATVSSSGSLPTETQVLSDSSQVAALAPSLGFIAGQNLTGMPSCNSGKRQR